MELTSQTMETNAETDKNLSAPLLKVFRESWLGGTGTGYDDPRVNLLYADLTGLPPINIYYGEYEILAGSVVEFAGRAKAAGLDVGLHSIPAGQHLFLLGAGRVPETDTAITEMGRWLRSKLGLGLAALPAG
jgi:acetyl esterase/lipase